jgi:anthranilate synthase component 2
MRRILLLDNYDSFTYNLAHLVRQVAGRAPDVIRNDEIDLDEVERYGKILLSPGPGLPAEAGLMPALIRRYAPRKSILGVCLGHQCIAEAFGAKLENLSVVCHGQGWPTLIGTPDEPLFKGVSSPFISGRYHSWVVKRKGFPDCLEITAVDEAGRVMALRHREFDVCGVQFHPESVLTPEGAAIMRNWLED